MYDILRLAGVLVLIIVLLRRKVKIGLVMLLASAALAALYAMRPSDVIKAARQTLANPATLKLAVALTVIRMLELVLRERNVLTEMMEAAKAVLRNRKMVIVSMPLLIGMLPSVGGAYFSAPMVEESSRGLGMPREEKGFVNYWFRHPWEFVFPLYPGLLLAAAISGMGLRLLILLNLSCALAVAVTGFVFSMRGVKGTVGTPGLSKRGAVSFLPLLAVIVLVVGFGVELHYALAGVVLALFLAYRYKWRDIAKALGYGLSPEVLLLIAGVMLFKETMEVSGAVMNLNAAFTSWGVPMLPMLFLLPFVGGALTGLTLGFVGGTFPLVMSMVGPDAHAAVSFAFAAGFLGVLLSPVHVCLVLTREYFRADMWGIYRKMLPASASVLTVAIAQYILLRYL